MEGHIHHHHQHQQLQHNQQQYQQHHQYGVVQQSMGGMVGVDTGDRFPQWSVQETKEFLEIRAELDQAFMETKRNKLLWEVISSKMRDKGFFRSSDQCKCKWKNLVTRYKGCETIEDETLRQQFPFYNEMQAIFTSRMQRMLWAEAEAAAETSRKTKQPPPSSGEDEEEDDDQEEGEDDQQNPESMIMKKMNKNKIKKTSKRARVMVGGERGGIIMAVKEMVEEIMKQQMEMEEKWREAYEAREEERRRVEREWRERMEALENERVEIERRWRERDEQRRLREEVRAEHRDALITALLNKLSNSQLPPPPTL